MKNKKSRHVARAVRVFVSGGLLTGCLWSGVAAHAALTFQFQYADSQNTGFLDPIEGPSRRAALNTAASQFSNMFGSHFSSSDTAIVLKATSFNDPNDPELAAAAGYYTQPDTPGFNLGDVVRTKILTGADLNGANADGMVEVNFGNNWELNYNKPVSSNSYDFYSTLFHEFTHALGFSSSISTDDNTKDGTPYFDNQNSWDTFDSFISDRSGYKIIDPNTFVLNQDAWQADSAGPSAGLYFDGSNAVAANGGQLVDLYTPEKWDGGSSVSHLNDHNPALEGMLMLAASPPGPGARDYSHVEVGVLTDLGYTPAVVPEPETYAMMLAGLAMLGWIARRRSEVGSAG